MEFFGGQRTESLLFAYGDWLAQSGTFCIR